MRDLTKFKDLEEFKDKISARWFKKFQDYCLEVLKTEPYVPANIIENFIDKECISPYDDDCYSRLRYEFDIDNTDVGISMFNVMIEFFKLYQSEYAKEYDFVEKSTTPQIILKELYLLCFDNGNIFPRFIDSIEQDIENREKAQEYKH